MKLPSRMLDISVALDNETVLDPHFMRPKIEYLTGKQNARANCAGVSLADLAI